MTDARLSGHLSSADLARHLLDEARTPGPAEERAHLGRCAACRDRLEVFERVGAAARAGLLDGPLVSPPPRVWEAILAEARAERRTAADRAGGPPVPARDAGQRRRPA